MLTCTGRSALFCSVLRLLLSVSPLLPISLGSAGGNASYYVAASQNARSVFGGSLCPGACHPFDQLSLQLFTAKLNLAGGCSGPATDTIAPTMAAVDSFLAEHAWAGLEADSQDSAFPAGYMLDVLRWTRLLRTFNMAASPAGQWDAEAIRDAELSNSGSSALLAQWNATAGLCGVPTECPDSTSCSAAALADEREQRFQPANTPFVPPDPRVVETAIPPYTPYILIATTPKLDWPKLGYTRRDWERWDGFDFQTDFIAPTLPDVEPVSSISDTNTLYSPMVSSSAGAAPSALSPSPAPAGFVRDWSAELSGVLQRTFFASAYENWRAMNTLNSRPLLLDLYGPQTALYYFDPRCQANTHTTRQAHDETRERESCEMMRIGCLTSAVVSLPLFAASVRRRCSVLCCLLISAVLSDASQHVFLCESDVQSISRCGEARPALRIRRCGCHGCGAGVSDRRRVGQPRAQLPL